MNKKCAVKKFRPKFEFLTLKPNRRGKKKELGAYNEADELEIHHLARPDILRTVSKPRDFMRAA